MEQRVDEAPNAGFWIMVAGLNPGFHETKVASETERSGALGLSRTAGMDSCPATRWSGSGAERGSGQGKAGARDNS